jgi:hypothetical protein
MNQSFPVTQLRRLVLIFMSWNLLRLWTAISWRGVLSEFSANPGIWYNILVAAFWAGCGFWLWWMLARARPGARMWLLIASAGFSLNFWFETLVLISQPRLNWPFMLVVNIVVLLVVTIFSNYIEERGV